MIDQELKLAILKTISFFDLFDYPLTKLEVYKFLYQPVRQYSFFEVTSALGELKDNELSLRHGVYFLAGREQIVNVRQQRYRLANNKFKLMLRGTWLLSLIPGVLFVGACNNIAMNNAKADSDIDVFIVTKKNRIWLVRFLTTTILTMVRLRRHGKNIANRLCLSFYVTEDNLELSDISLKPKDPYLVFWLASLVPVYDSNNFYHKLEQSNSWINAYLPNILLVNPNSRHSIFLPNVVKYYRRVVDLILDGFLGKWANDLSKKLQLFKIKRNSHSLWQYHDNRVVINDQMLKFHENDRRQFYLELWQKKLDQLFSK
jgi:hypothetical protein